MKRNVKKNGIRLKKIQIAKITNLSCIKGGFGPDTQSNHRTCTKTCADNPDEPQV